MSTIGTLGFALVILGSLAVALNLLGRLFAWWTDRRIQTVDDLEIPIDDSLPSPPRDADPVCPRCSSVCSSLALTCWRCSTVLDESFAEATDTPEPPRAA